MRQAGRLGYALRCARAIATNQLARCAPALYVRATGQTGRGAADTETAEDIAAYFLRCVDDYLEMLSVDARDARAFLHGKSLLEYGPGDLPGVAMLLVAHGAARVTCVDRFPMFVLSGKNLDVIGHLLKALPDEGRRRLDACFVVEGDPASGLRPDKVDYLVRPSGCSGLIDAADIVLSRAVLEHVNDLAALFADMVAAMRVGGVAVHQVDLRSHGLHRSNPLDFLAVSPRLWDLLYSHKGVPNRVRIDSYRSLLARLPVAIRRLDTTRRAEQDDVAGVRPHLAAPFRHMSDDDLSCLGFWLVFEKSEHRALH